MIVKVNGRPLDTGQRGIIHRKDNAPDSIGVVRITREIPLEPGENVLEVMAKGESSLSNPAVVRISREVAKVDPFRPNLYVLAIWVSDYERDELNLQFANADAEGIANAFKM